MCKVTVSKMRERYAQKVLTFRITYVYYVLFMKFDSILKRFGISDPGFI